MRDFTVVKYMIAWTHFSDYSLKFFLEGLHFLQLSKHLLQEEES